MRTAVLKEREEPLAIREVDRPEPDPAAVVPEHVAPEDVDRELEATTDRQTLGIPVVTEFA